MFHNILGRVVWLTSSQESLIERTSKMCTQWEAEKLAKQQEEDMKSLRYHLMIMETRCSKPCYMWRTLHSEYYTSKHHAYEYNDFTFNYEGKVYRYDNGVILNEDFTVNYELTVEDYQMLEDEPF